MRISGINFDKALTENLADVSLEKVEPPILKPVPALKKQSLQSGSKSTMRHLLKGASFMSASRNKSQHLYGLQQQLHKVDNVVGETALPAPHPPPGSARRQSVPVASLNERPATVGSKNSTDSNPLDSSTTRKGPDVMVSFCLMSPITGRVLQRSMVEGKLTRLNKAQMHQLGAAGATAFANLTGTLSQPDPDMYAGNSLPVHDTQNCVCASMYSSIRVGVAAAENASAARHEDCVIQCKVPPCPGTLLAKQSSFVACVEVSLNGSEGPFSADSAKFEYVRPPVLKSIAPSGFRMIPGETVMKLSGQSLGIARMMCVHLTLITSPKPGKSQYSQVRVIERIGLPYNTEPQDTNAERLESSAGDNPELSQTCINALLPFFVRRRYANCQPRCVRIAPRAGNLGVKSSTLSSTLHAKSGMHTPMQSDTVLKLWLHSQPVLDDTMHADKATKPDRRTNPGRQTSSTTPKRSYRRKLSTQSASRSRGSTAHQHHSNQSLGQEHAEHFKSTRFRRDSANTQLRSRFLSRTGGTDGIGRDNHPNRKSGQSHSQLPLRGNDAASYVHIEPDCLVEEIGIELSLNGQDWNDRASRRVKLGMPYELTRIEPESGPLRGGTKITVHGKNFPVGCDKCLVAFLCLGVSPRPSPLLAELRQKSKGSAYEVYAKTDRPAAVVQQAIRNMQRVARGRIYRKLSKHGVPCACVPAVVESSTTISCIAPGSLVEGQVDVVVSFDGHNFEWAPTEKLKFIRVRNMLMEMGVPESEAKESATQIARELRSQGDSFSCRTRTALQQARGSTSSSRFTLSQVDSGKLLSSHREFSLCGLSDAPHVFDASLQLSYKYFVLPVIEAIREVQPPFTDSIDIVGHGFKIGSEVLVQFRTSEVSNQDSYVVRSNIVCTGRWTLTGAQASGEVIDEDLITVVSPKVLQNGSKVEVAVSMNGGFDYTNTLWFSAYKKPLLESIHPSCGPRYGGSIVQIRGNNFLPSLHHVKVRFSLDTGNASTGSVELCTVSSVVEGTTRLQLELPPFENIVDKAKVQGDLDQQVYRIWHTASNYGSCACAG